MYPLASLPQISQSPSPLPLELELALRSHGCKLIHEATTLLRLPHVASATAQILFQRFWVVSSLHAYSVSDTAFGALYLAAKLEECAVRIRDLVNVFHVLLHRDKHRGKQKAEGTERTLPKVEAMSYFGNTFYELKDRVVVAEMHILKRLGFNTNVVLPFGSLINYLRLLGHDTPDVVQKSWGYLNDAMQTTVYTVYQIPTIVSAAILLTTRFLGIALPDAWWVLFDAEWEDIWSVCGHIMHLYHAQEAASWDVHLLMDKKDVRKWSEENPIAAAS
ncbi:cyclin-like protein [Cylindrobasidium torrendii FP15055 ss-10]|uniref:Cyclin-like protein n=1 Tax=Cylindrobasidium torrendii FP15055 ss-10 TaxID=1314674 RepID=A0A0D7B0E3_9AGAR|nr:cyclin-like protein [Cylindrobasidium torrendii FP15055 ss-10]